MKLRQFIEGQRKKRKSISKTTRLNMWKQCHGRCWYCGCDVPKTFFVLEHVEPFSRGGADSKRNLVVSCWQCDRDKGGKNLEEFRKRRGGGLFYGEQPKPPVEPRTPRVVEIDTSFGWIDQFGQLRPRSWEEYCQMQKDQFSQDMRDARSREKERREQATNPRMVRLGEALQKAGLSSNVN